MNLCFDRVGASRIEAYLKDLLYVGLYYASCAAYQQIP